MPSPHGTTSPNALQPALELIYLATLQPDLASQSLRKLLLANPNHFDNLPQASVKVVLNSLGLVQFIQFEESMDDARAFATSQVESTRRAAGRASFTSCRSCHARGRINWVVFSTFSIELNKPTG